jgi:mRNA interferase RelE/StbE
MLELDILNKAEKFLKKLNKSDKKLSKQIINKIIELKNNPEPLTSKPIINYTPYRRIRVGKYRVIYRYDEKNLYIIIINKREIVYKDLNKFLKF